MTRCLVIFSLDDLRKGIPNAAYKPLTGDDKPTAGDFDRRNKRDKGEAAGILDFSGRKTQPGVLPPLAASLRAVRELPEDTVQQIEAKRERFHTAHSDPRLVNLAQAADLYIAAFLMPKTESQSLDLRTSLVPTTADVWTAMRSGTVYGPRLGAARQLAIAARAFHWPLEFPDVMANGGFDVVLGNPPWERIKIQEQEFFASREPGIAEAPNAAARGRMIERIKQAEDGTRERALYLEFETTKRIAEASALFTVASERFERSGQNDVNTFPLFAETALRILKEAGAAGIVLPFGFATDVKAKRLFAFLFESAKVQSFYGFDNSKGIFPAIHRDTPFGLLTIRSTNGLAEFTSELTAIAQLRDRRRRYTLTASDLLLMNPNTGTAPVFRSLQDARIVTSIYSRLPVFFREKVPGHTGNPWDVSFLRMFDSASDSDKFEVASELVNKGLSRRGLRWERSSETSITIAALPLYEGKMIGQFDHRAGTFEGISDRPPRGASLPEPAVDRKADPNFEIEPWYWVAAQLVDDVLSDSKWTADWSFGYRFGSNPTNERTLILSAIPRSAAPHVFPQIITGQGISARLVAALLANLNSLVTDYVCRQKMSRQGVDIFIVKQLPVLPPDYYQEEGLAFVVSRALELTYTSHSLQSFAHDLGYDGSPFGWDDNRRALLRAELDAWFARAYGLTRDELRSFSTPQI